MSAILFEVRNHVAVITLNRPEKLNSFNREMALSLQKALDDCNSKEVRAVYITGAGKGFCAGQDLAEVVADDAPGFDQILSEHYNPIVIRLRNLARPVVAAVNGVAAGAGANLALCCDIVVASESASFIQAFSKIGLVPDTAGTYFLPRLVGMQKAAAVMMLGDKVPAAEAERMGMIYKVYNDQEFASASFKLAETLAQMPTKALAFIKHMLTESAEHTLEQQLEMEDEYQQKAAGTKDYSEGVLAFMEKRAPKFTGE
ncbi:MAG: 2-(1,2-epoxy,2-dihydrophenyl)acetyl-CoA isomerase [Chitinophagaceae bacterium]|jgi:2-(1,2-epoxy-1,2-dihydrophenyl)acetyl-CoA isomerase|nr:2-(1,2-epoxy,2-dihydrophenyl)acetyl-CoA isomerase [Chitinophagaceae bacterium]